MKDLANWLKDENASFNEGLCLFKKYAKDKSYLDYFERNTDSNVSSQPWNILRDELIRIPINLETVQSPALSDDEKLKVDRAVKKLSQVAEKSENPFFDPNKLPESGKLIYKRIQDIGKELASAKAGLDKATTDEERKKYADALCNLEDERYDRWDEIDALRDDCNAEEVDNSKSDAAKAVNLYKRYLVLRNNIARNEKEASKKDLDAQRKEKLLSGAAKFKVELESVENEFKNITGTFFDAKSE